MKILQIGWGYKKGSVGKITSDLHEELKKRGIESVVCYGRGPTIKEENIYKVSTELYSRFNHFLADITGTNYGRCFFSTNQLLSIIKKEKPDIVHLQCINGYFVNIYRLLNFLKRKKIPTVCTLHAEFMYTGGCGYALDCNKWKNTAVAHCGHAGKCPNLKNQVGSWFFDRTGTMLKKMNKSFEGFDQTLIVVSVSEWLERRAKESLVLKNKDHRVVLNGIDDVTFTYKKNDELRNKFAPNGERIIFHPTTYFNLIKNHLKGGYYVNEVGKALKNENVKILVAGNRDFDLDVAPNVTLLGTITNQKELASYYSIADLSLITSKKETFSMPVAESLCCGTPIVGFKAGAPEMIAIPEYSEFVDQNDVNSLLQTIRKFLNSDFDKTSISEEASKKYGRSAMAEGYVSVYKELLNKVR